MPPLQIALALCHPAAREHVLAAAAHPDVRVHSVTAFGEAAVNADEANLPDLLLLSTALPALSWREILRRVEEALGPPVQIIVVSHCIDEVQLAKLLASGMNGDACWEDSPGRILRTVEQANARAGRCNQEQPSGPHPGYYPIELTERECEVLHLLALGHGNRRIAEALHLSHGTVRNYLSKLYRRIGAETRLEAVQWAWRHGYARYPSLSPPPGAPSPG